MKINDIHSRNGLKLYVWVRNMSYLFYRYSSLSFWLLIFFHYIFYLSKSDPLEIENKKLLLEVGELKGELKTIKKHAQVEDNAICADASGSDLER